VESAGSTPVALTLFEPPLTARSRRRGRTQAAVARLAPVVMKRRLGVSATSEVRVFKKAVFPGRYIQGAGALGELPALTRVLGTKGLLLASPSVVNKVLPGCALDSSWQALRIEPFRGECCEPELARVSALLAGAHADVLIGMGGGKTIDTAKIVADRARVPVVVVPTIASTDAPCSGCAVIYSEGGVFEAVSYQRMNPAAVVVDLEIIAAAPARFLVAGMGDALATWFEAKACDRTQSVNECGGLSTRMGLSVARLCYDTLLAFGAAAKADCERHAVTPALDSIVEANTLLSGIGFESGGLATAHSVHNGLTALPETHAFYHGEKVAFGTLTGLHFVETPTDEMETVNAFCEEVGLPTTLAEIGVRDAARARLLDAATRACASDQPIHHEPGRVTPERVLDAMLAADALGRKRKGRP
jgi:glycerol dehydrogenase